MSGTKLQVRLFRDSFATPWGFRLQGGKDLNQPLVVQRVFCNSPAEGQLQRGDIIESIGIKRGVDLSHKQAQDSLKHGGGQIELLVTRPPSGRVGITPTPTINITPGRTRAPQQKPQMPQPPSYGHQPKKVTPKYGGGGPDFATDYSGVPPSTQSRAGNYKPADQYNMLNRVQGSLDNIILSPRTPEASPSHAPFYQQYEQPYAPPPQQQPAYNPYMQPQYVSTGERLDNMNEFSEYPGQITPANQPQQYAAQPQGFCSTAARLDDIPPEDEDNAVPVWERRQAFLGPSSYSHDPRPIKPKRSGPKFKKPTGPIYGTDYTKVGIDYAQRQGGGSRPSSGVWQPPPPQQQQYDRPPDATSYRTTSYEDGEPTVPVWRNTLKTTGVKPWDEDIDYGTHRPAPEVHVAPRHIKKIEIQLKQPTMKPMQPVKVTQKAPGSAKAPTATDGERDWTQSAVFRMVAQDEGPPKGQPQRQGGQQQRQGGQQQRQGGQQQRQGGQQQRQGGQQQTQGQQRGPPPVMPKPSPQPPQFQQNQFQTPFDDEVGVSDF